MTNSPVHIIDDLPDREELSQEAQLRIVRNDHIIDCLSSGPPKPIQQIADETGYTDRQVRIAVEDLILHNKIQVVGKDGRKILYQVTDFTHIPTIRYQNARVNTMRFVKGYEQTQGKNTMRLIALLQAWPRAFIIPFHHAEQLRTGTTPNQEELDDAKKYFTSLEKELSYLIDLVKQIIKDDRFWLPDEIAKYEDDAQYNAQTIRRAFNYIFGNEYWPIDPRGGLNVMGNV